MSHLISSDDCFSQSDFEFGLDLLGDASPDDVIKYCESIECDDESLREFALNHTRNLSISTAVSH